MKPRQGSSRDERGIAMIYVTMFLLSSLWFVSLAVDMGKLMTTRTELQQAADAAALAGASAIDSTGRVLQAVARVRATETAARNTALRETAEPVVIDPNADVDFPNEFRVRVRVHREDATGNPMTTIFARTLGITDLNVTADATAEVTPLDQICDGLTPFAPIQIDSGYTTACGSSFDLKVGSGQQNSGNFQLLDFPDCAEGPCAGVGGGADEIRCLVINGYGCCISIGDQFVDTAPGNKVGPLRQAIQERWDLDTDRRENICYQQYTGNQRRVFTVPIVRTWDLNGKKNAEITAFAAFFLLNRPQGGGQGSFARGQFIEYVAPGVSGPNPPPDTMVFGIRLVE